jgi:hypothetical protein
VGSNPSIGQSRRTKAYGRGEITAAAAPSLPEKTYPQFGDFFIVNKDKLYFYFIFTLEKFDVACVLIEIFTFTFLFL